MATQTKRRASLVPSATKPVSTPADLIGGVQNPFDTFFNQMGVAPASQILTPGAPPSAPGVPPRSGTNPADAMQLKKDLMFGRHVGWGHDNITPADKWAGMFKPASERAGLQTTAPTAESMRAAGPALMAATRTTPTAPASAAFPTTPALSNAMRPPGTPGAFGEPAENPGFAMQGKAAPFQPAGAPTYQPPMLTSPTSVTGSVTFDGPASGGAEAVLAAPPVGGGQPLGPAQPVSGTAGASNIPKPAYPTQVANYLKQFLRF